MRNRLKIWIAGLALLISGCLTEEPKASSESSGPGLSVSNFNINSFPLNKVVCEPFSTAAAAEPANGIRTKLFYRMQGMPRYYSAQQYIDLTQASGKEIFMSQINVPTRPFESGFATQTLEVMKDDQGNKLIEYFGLKMNTVIRLGDNDPEGVYELSLLADDGSVMKIKNPDETWSTLINNDGDHPTQMGCTTRSISMTRRTKLEAEVTYYQGPRYHISEVLMWRLVPAGKTAGQDSECGKQGNNYFFDPDHGSIPLAPYEGLLARGWKVLDPSNFFVVGADVDPGTVFNPCTLGTNPVITDFVVNEKVVTDIFLSWSTNIPATDQVLVTNVQTGISILTVSDNILRTLHQVRVSNLTGSTAYSLRAVSISDSLGKALSEPLLVSTPGL